MKKFSTSNMRKRSGWVIFGVVLTLAYLGGLAYILASDRAESSLHIKQPTEFTLNTFGDFLAGASAPLAFLWLFVATMVQSQELALQREELSLTRREFQQNREVAKQQADEAKSQAAFIGAQTKILQSAEIDKLIDVRIDGFMQDQWLLGSIAKRTEDREFDRINFGVKPDRGIGYAADAFASWAEAARSWDREKFIVYYEFEETKNVKIGDALHHLRIIKQNIENASEQKKAELENRGFEKLLEALEFLEKISNLG
ncbi:hypothetical protein EN813_009975 [Mesorhizobium sp. M00.F.Ca.ET.170.01.1.1]|nr:hypothetical protein EN813_009975 [Mesorhizobium sp. M00.F.Ca.ET.170.01.1.1]